MQDRELAAELLISLSAKFENRLTQPMALGFTLSLIALLCWARHLFKEDLVRSPGKQTTADEGVQYLRDLAVLEVTYKIKCRKHDSVLEKDSSTA